MSLNHIILNSVPDDEALDVKFNNIFCKSITVAHGSVPVTRRFWYEPITTMTYITIPSASDNLGISVDDNGAGVVNLTSGYTSIGGTGTVCAYKNGVQLPIVKFNFASATPVGIGGATFLVDGDVVQMYVSHDTDPSFSPYEFVIQKCGSAQTAYVTHYTTFTPLPNP